MSRKGMQMSINVVVGLILGLLMFGAGIVIFFQIYTQSENVSIKVDAQIRQKMLQAFNDGDILFVPETDKTADPKKPTIISFGIHNILDTQENFLITITNVDPTGNDPTFAYFDDLQEVDAKDKEIFQVLVTTKNLPKGQYAILISIDYTGNPTPPYAKRIVRVNVR